MENLNLPIQENNNPLSKYKINTKQVITFLALTFGLTWLLDLVLYLNGGLLSPLTTVVLQLQMLLPAFSAMLLGVFFFKDSPLYKQTNRSSSRWFIYYFMAFTIFYAIVSIVCFIKPDLLSVLNPFLLIPSIIGLILYIVLRVKGGKETFTAVNMTGGKAIKWLLYGVLLFAVIALQTALNYVFKLGQPAHQTLLEIQAASSGMSYSVMMLVVVLNTVVLGPFLGLLIAFGEEYGWRGYLQQALTRTNKRLGVLFVGIIWGVWHWPVIWMGYNYPGQPLLGSLFMVIFCIAMAFILGYAYFKTKSVWLCAFLHALLNQSMSFFLGFVYTPNDLSMSFGMGLPGLAILGLVALLLLRDPVWKTAD